MEVSHIYIYSYCIYIYNPKKSPQDYWDGGFPHRNCLESDWKDRSVRFQKEHCTATPHYKTVPWSTAWNLNIAPEDWHFKKENPSSKLVVHHKFQGGASQTLQEAEKLCNILGSYPFLSRLVKWYFTGCHGFCHSNVVVFQAPLWRNAILGSLRDAPKWHRECHRF